MPFAMGGAGTRSGDHAPVGSKTPASPGNVLGNSQQPNQARKKTRIDVKDVFNNDDDDDGTNNSKKRKLIPLGKSPFYKIQKRIKPIPPKFYNLFNRCIILQITEKIRRRKFWRKLRKP